MEVIVRGLDKRFTGLWRCVLWLGEFFSGYFFIFNRIIFFGRLGWYYGEM